MSVYSLRKLSKQYANRTVLNIPALEIKRQETLVVVGPSGAGKSTLLRLLALLEAPTAGSVTLHIDERNVTHVNARQDDLRQISMVFQRPVLLNRNVWSNVAYGLQVRSNRNGQQQITDALEQVSMLPFAQSLPRELSGGELQRVAFARALVIEPQILLLDEPTANLDPLNVRIIEGLIEEQKTNAKTTTVLVTHNIFQAKRLADRVAFIYEGELVEIAPVDDFFQNPKDERTAAFVSGDLVY